MPTSASCLHCSMPVVSHGSASSEGQMPSVQAQLTVFSGVVAKQRLNLAEILRNFRATL